MNLQSVSTANIVRVLFHVCYIKKDLEKGFLIIKVINTIHLSLGGQYAFIDFCL